jgi:hypothetical protein
MTKERHEWPGKGPGSAGVPAGLAETIAAAKAQCRRSPPGKRLISRRQLAWLLDLAEARGIEREALDLSAQRLYGVRSIEGLERGQASAMIVAMRQTKP